MTVFTYAQDTGERHGSRPTGRLDHLCRAGLLNPSPQDPSTSRIRHAPRSIVIPVVQFALAFRMEFQSFLVEGPDLPICLVLGGVEKDVLFTKWEEVRALPHLGASNGVGQVESVPSTFGQRVYILERAGVLGPVEEQGAAKLVKARPNADVPCVAIFPCEWISKASHLHAIRWTVYDRLRQFVVMHKIFVVRDGYALHFAQPLVPNSLLFSWNLRYPGVDDRPHTLSAGQYSACKRAIRVISARSWSKSDGHVLPVNEIPTDRVMPASSSVTPVEERVITPFEELRSTRVTQKARLRKQMKLRSERVNREPRSEGFYSLGLLFWQCSESGGGARCKRGCESPG